MYIRVYKCIYSFTIHQPCFALICAGDLNLASGAVLVAQLVSTQSTV